MRNTTSPEAKLMNKEFLSLINVLGGYTPWSTAERQRTLGKLYAMSNFMGPPSFFFTIAPCIADSEICLKFLNFPTFKYKIRQSTHEQRSIWSAQHPLARRFTLLWTLSLPPLLVYLQVIPNILSQLTVWYKTIPMIILPFQQDLKHILDLGLDASVFLRPSTAFMRLKDGGIAYACPHLDLTQHRIVKFVH